VNSRTLWGGVTLLLALVSVIAVPSNAASASSPLTFHDTNGIHVVSESQLDPRQFNIVVLSPALGRPVNVRILIPANYAAQSEKSFPVLYLFHGTSGRASDWINYGGAEQTTAGLPLIVVMPDAGFNGDGGGWFTNWVDTTTSLGPSQWETFDIGDLIPWVDANLRTIASRDGRAVAGLSQGGFGSMTYAARHPDMFVSVASFSGAPDIDYDPVVAAGATAIIDATEVGLDGVEPDAMFGSRVTDEINWQGHDPADLVTNLRDTDIWLYTATGLPGPYDSFPPSPYAMAIEGATHISTLSFYARAEQLGVPAHLDDYTFGTHSFPYWARDLRWYIGPLMATFANPPPAPLSVSYESIDQSWSQWGWSVSLQRSAQQQFSALSGAKSSGFILQGTGVAAVGTPDFYVPGSVHVVKMVGAGGTTQATAIAGKSGQLLIRVELGPGGLTGGSNEAVIGLPGILSGLATTTVTIS
jgi:S-formylglutathione hydrolase FrmB